MESVTSQGVATRTSAFARLRGLCVSARPWRRPAFYGLVAALGLIAFYIGMVSLAEGWYHARGLLWEDRFFVGPISAGFGTQVALYFQLRYFSRHGAGGQATALAASGTGASGVSMVACCLHHATDVLPLMGLSGAAIFLGQYRLPFMALALTMNLAGIAYMGRKLRRVGKSCH